MAKRKQKSRGRGSVMLITRATLVSASLISSACLRTDFDPPSVIDSVRLLASKASKPYAKPGEQVELSLLAVDGRVNPARPMQTYWIPIVCPNPPRDLYYLCFAQAAAQQAAGGAGNGGSNGQPQIQLKPGMDLTPFLQPSRDFKFTVPANLIATHPPTPGAPAPYGLAVVFNIACAGRVKLEAPSENPQSVPLGCYDDQNNRLPPEDFMVGFTRVYAYENRSNENPVIDRVLFDGKTVGDQGIEVDHCTNEEFSDCDTKDIEVDVPVTSWEVNDLSKDAKGNPQHESIWSTWYATLGRFDSEIRLVYEASSGKVDESRNKLEIPRETGKGTVWVVVRDNRGGAVWREIPVTIK